jgi:hypothetical protein
MALLLPQATDELNAPDHSFLHRVVAVDAEAPEQSLTIDIDGNAVLIGTLEAGGFTTTGTGTFGKVSTSQTMSFTLPYPYNFYYNDIVKTPLIVKTLYAMTITNIEVSCDADPATEPTGDIKYADTLIGLANATLIHAFDTTAGVFSSGAESIVVPIGKCIYLKFDAQPSALIRSMTFTITFTY